MWKVSYRIVSEELDESLSKCRVCKQQTSKIRISEAKRLIVFFVIPIPQGEQAFEICTTCRARVSLNVNRNLLDSNLS